MHDPALRISSAAIAASSMWTTATMTSARVGSAPAIAASM